MTSGLGEQDLSCLVGTREGREGVTVLEESVCFVASVALLAIDLREHLAALAHETSCVDQRCAPRAEANEDARRRTARLEGVNVNL